MSTESMLNVGGAKVYYAEPEMVKKTYVEGDKVCIELKDGAKVSYKTQKSGAAIHIKKPMIDSNAPDVIFEGINGGQYVGSSTKSDSVTLDKNCKGCIVNTRNGGPGDLIITNNSKNSIFLKDGDFLLYRKEGYEDGRYIAHSDETILH